MPFLVLLLLGALLSLAVRSGAGFARGAAVLAMLAVAVAALVPPGSRLEPVPAQVAVACTGAPTALGVEAAVTAAIAPAGAGATARCVTGADLPAALARAALAAGPRADEVCLVWNGPLAAAAPLSRPVAGAAYTAVMPLAFDPATLFVRAVAPPRRDRPLRLEVGAQGLDREVAAELVVRVVGAPEQRRSVQLSRVGAVAVDVGVLDGDHFEVELALAIDGHRIVRRGSHAIADAPVVVVLDRGSLVANALAAQGIDVRRQDSLPSDLHDVQAVVVAMPMPVADQERLAGAVEGGLGLFAFAPGLQRQDEPLHRVLPLKVAASADDKGHGDGPGRPTEAPRRSPPPEQPSPPSNVRPDGAPVDPGGPVEVDKHEIAMVFVVDRSESMGEALPGGATKMSFVKTAANSTAKALMPGDQVGIISFGNEDLGRTVLPLTDVADRAAVDQGIAGLADAKERTFLQPGLRLAQEQLAKSTVAVRHVVVLTDGEFWDLETTLRSIAHEMKEQGMTLSIIAITTDTTSVGFRKNAELIAKDGGGAFLAITDPRKVPQIVSAEVVHALGQVGRVPRGDGTAGEMPQPDRTPPPVTEPPAPEPTPLPEPPTESPMAVPVLEVAKNSPLLLPRLASWPAIGGVVDGVATFDARVLLVAGTVGQPLLAYCNRGLGRTGVLAADLGHTGSAAFVAVDAFPARLAQWITAVSPPERGEPADLQLDLDVKPAAPSPAEVAQLLAASGAPPRPLAQLHLPGERMDRVVVSQVPRFSLGALAALVALALIEWICIRRGGA